jgi:hypothetical protein
MIFRGPLKSMISEDHDDMRHNKSCDERREKQPLF